MESMNKFKALTIIIVCMFVFAIAAIYSNTKDASEGKLNPNHQTENEQIKSETDNNENTSTDLYNLTSEVEFLTKRVDELSEKVGNQGSTEGSTSLKCSIYGSVTSNGIEQLSPEAAVQEAKENNNELVITCSF